MSDRQGSDSSRRSDGSGDTRKSDGSNASSARDLPRVMLYEEGDTQGQSEDFAMVHSSEFTLGRSEDFDTHSELDLDLYENDDVVDLTKESPVPIAGAEFQHVPILDRRPGSAYEYLDTTSNSSSQRTLRQRLQTGTESTTSSSHMQQRRGPFHPEPYIRTDFTTAGRNARDDTSTPNAPYDNLATPPADPGSARPGDLEQVPGYRDSNLDLQISIRPLWLGIAIIAGFALGQILLLFDLSSEWGDWLTEIGSLFTRLVNCVTLPMAFCQVVVSVAELTTKNSLRPLLMKTALLALGICFVSIIVSLAITAILRPYMKQHDDLGLTLSHATFAFKCPNDNYMEIQSDASMTCTGATVATNSTFLWMDDQTEVLGIDNSVAIVNISEYMIALLKTYVPSNFVNVFVTDLILSVFVIAIAMGVAITRSFRGIQSRTNPLRKLFMHIYSSLFTMMQWIQHLMLFATIPILVGDSLQNPEMSKLLRLTQLYNMGCLLLFLTHGLMIVPGVFYYFTRQNPFVWMYRNISPVLAAIVFGDALLPLSIATTTVLKTKEIPWAIFGALYPILTAFNRLVYALGLPISLIFVSEFSGCGLELNGANLVGLFALTLLGSLGDTALAETRLAFFMTMWRSFCSNEDTPSAILVISSLVLITNRLASLSATMTNIMLVRVASTFKEAQQHF